MKRLLSAGSNTRSARGRNAHFTRDDTSGTDPAEIAPLPQENEICVECQGLCVFNVNAQYYYLLQPALNPAIRKY